MVSLRREYTKFHITVSVGFFPVKVTFWHFQLTLQKSLPPLRDLRIVIRKIEHIRVPLYYVPDLDKGADPPQRVQHQLHLAHLAGLAPGLYQQARGARTGT